MEYDYGDLWWLQPLVWTDYRLAVLFTVIVPLILLVWAFVQKADAMTRLLIIYWRVASLLAITVYLLIPAWSVGYATGWLARILIPISLWFWADLNEEIADRPRSPLTLSFTAWRWATTIYCILGVIGTTYPALTCTFSPNLAEIPHCRVWLEAPWLYKQWIHPNSTPGFLGFLGVIGLIFYGFYLAYFIIVRLGKQGRSAIEE